MQSDDLSQLGRLIPARKLSVSIENQLKALNLAREGGSKQIATLKVL